MRRCPFCAEEIQDAAVKCRFCGSVLAGQQAAPPPDVNQPVSPQVPAPRAAVVAAAHDPHHLEQRVLFEGSPSWRAYLWSYVGAVALVLAGLWLGGYLLYAYPDRPEYAAGGGVLVIAGLVWFLVVHLQRRATRIRITTLNIDRELGVFGRTIHTIQLWRVRDIDFEQSFAERLMGAARIRVVSHDQEQPTVVLRGLPGSRQLFLDLRDSIAIARQGRNVVGLVD